jgi:sulfonate transport system substrate-binding protein
MSRTPFLRSALVAGAAATALLLSGCVAGEGQAAEPEPTTTGEAVSLEGQTLNIDFATYNPLSLIIKDQGWLEDAGLTVNWVQSAGSNKANEALRAGAIDVGSTAGSAALLARSNGSPIQVIDIYSQPEWSALVAPDGSPITSVEDLKGKQVAATKGTDPYFFLLQSLEAEGLEASDITVQNLQHADGWAALQNGSVDAWAGLDPIMAGAEEQGANLFYRNVDFNSYGFLNATESFLADKPEVAQAVVDAYETARAWAAENPDETAEILAGVAGLDPAVATKVITERSNLDVDPVPGDAQVEVLEKIGPIFVELGDVPTQQQVDDALDTIINDEFVTQADAGRFS